jgi:hypothetical protein
MWPSRWSTADFPPHAKKNVSLISIVGLTALVAVAGGVEPRLDPVYRGKLKDLAPAPHVLGNKWVEATGVVVEDFANRDSYPTEARQSRSRHNHPMAVDSR